MFCKTMKIIGGISWIFGRLHKGSLYAQGLSLTFFNVLIQLAYLYSFVQTLFLYDFFYLQELFVIVLLPSLLAFAHP